MRELATNYDHEEAYVYLPDGRVYHKKGVLNKVAFTTEECKLFEGGVLMHNHPSATFSPEDIAFGIKHKLKEIRAVAPDKQYRAKLTQDLGELSLQSIKGQIEEAKDDIEKSMRGFNSKKYEYYLMNFHDYLD